MTDAEVAYLAGLFDGEGTVSINHASAGKPTLRMSIANTHKETMEWVAAATGAKLYETKYHLDRRVYTNNDQWKPVWTCVWLARKAAAQLRMLLPYLKIKRERAELGLEFQERLSREPGKRGHPSTFTLEEREKYHAKMRTLNSRTTK